MSVINRLIAGFRVFRATYYELRPTLFANLVQHGQQPKVMVIACSDARVDPAILLTVEPGELFVIRNVANLVPPYQPDGFYHGTSAALEFGVRDLEVEHIIVLGHYRCGGIRALRQVSAGHPVDREFITPWVSIACGPCCQELVDKGDAVSEADRIRIMEQAAIRTSLSNLRTFPWIREREDDGRISLHGWWFDLEKGELHQLNASSNNFEAI